MKIGDTFGVYIAGQQVAEAKIVELEDEKATLIVPATRVVMAVRTSLEPEVTPETPAVEGNQHVMLGLENENPVSETATVGGETVEVVGQPQAPQENAPAAQVEAVEGVVETPTSVPAAPANVEGPTGPVQSAEPVNE